MPTTSSKPVSPAHRRLVAEYEASFSYENCADPGWAAMNAHNNAGGLALANGLSWFDTIDMAARYASAVIRDQRVPGSFKKRRIGGAYGAPGCDVGCA